MICCDLAVSFLDCSVDVGNGQLDLFDYEEKNIVVMKDDGEVLDLQPTRANIVSCV